MIKMIASPEEYAATEDLARDTLLAGFERIRKALYGHAWLRTFDHHAAEDILSQTAIEVFSSAHRYDPSRSAERYIWRIARNTTVDYIRKKTSGIIEITISPKDSEGSVNLEKGDSGEFGDLEDIAISTEDPIFEGALRREEHEQLTDALKNETDESRAICSLFYDERMSTKDIAALFGMGQMQVVQKLFTLRNRVRRELGLTG